MRDPKVGHGSPIWFGSTDRRRRFPADHRSAQTLAFYSGIARELRGGFPGPIQFFPHSAFDARYLPAVASCELTVLKVVCNWVPRAFTTAMIATEIPAAINPYSMAVAPDSSFAKRATSLFM